MSHIFYQITLLCLVHMNLLAINIPAEPVKNPKKIVIIGAGYVGLVTGACFASVGNEVIIVENNPEKIKTLQHGNIPFFEPNLGTLLTQVMQKKKITFTESISQAMRTNPELIFLCVGTPSLADGSADLSFVMQAATDIGTFFSNYCIVVNKSTVPIGTTQKVKKIIQKQLELRNIIIDFDVVSNPEFLQEGCALENFFSPDRIVVGVENQKAESVLKSLYQPFLRQQEQFIVMNIQSAELTKYASNGMLATRISFMNQLAQLAEKVGASIDHIKKGMAKDRRIGEAFLNAGIGYGGSCFPKDVKALINTGKLHGTEMSLLQAVDSINEEQRLWFIKKIFDYYGDAINKKHIGIWGLSFKPDTDDIRGAPSIDVITALLAKGVKVAVYDPTAANNIQSLFGEKISVIKHASDILKICDALVILTEHKEFMHFAPQAFLDLGDKTIFDGRNCFVPEVMKETGINYISIGRG